MLEILDRFRSLGLCVARGEFSLGFGVWANSSLCIVPSADISLRSVVALKSSSALIPPSLYIPGWGVDSLRVD